MLDREWRTAWREFRRRWVFVLGGPFHAADLCDAQSLPGSADRSSYPQPDPFGGSLAGQAATGEAVFHLDGELGGRAALGAFGDVAGHAGGAGTGQLTVEVGVEVASVAEVIESRHGVCVTLRRLGTFRGNAADSSGGSRGRGRA